MPIQFLCPGCGQPIEVDDEHAGKAATCPYCQRVASVPMETTYRPDVVAAGRPAGLAGGMTVGSEPGAVSQPSPLPQPGALHVVAAPTQRERRGRTLGWYALACAVVVLALIVGMIVPITAAFMNKLGPGAIGQVGKPGPKAEEVSRIQTELLKDLQSKPWFLGLGFAVELLTVVGLALSIASLVYTRRRNWPGLVALIVCGLCVLCFCAGLAVQFGQGGLPSG